MTRTEIPAVNVVGNDLLGAVFRNLLNNAVQHNDCDNPVVALDFEVTDDVSVRIGDNGPGIPDDRKEAIFGKGEQALESYGTGLGLSLVQTLVNQFDGDVSVADSDPAGTVFTVTLPNAD